MQKFWIRRNSYIIDKKGGDIICPILVHLINLSLRTGVFPDKLKIAKVVPIYKSGDASNFSNYRPVSVLPVLSKIYEKVVYARVLKHLDNNNIIYNNQFGFRNKHSTSHAVIHLIDKSRKQSTEKNLL